MENNVNNKDPKRVTLRTVVIGLAIVSAVIGIVYIIVNNKINYNKGYTDGQITALKNRLDSNSSMHYQAELALINADSAHFAIFNDSLKIHNEKISDFQKKVVELEKKIYRNGSNSKTIKSLVTQISELQLRIEYLSQKKEETKPAPVENSSGEFPPFDGAGDGEFPGFNDGDLPNFEGGDLPF